MLERGRGRAIKQFGIFRGQKVERLLDHDVERVARLVHAQSRTPGKSRRSIEAALYSRLVTGETPALCDLHQCVQPCWYRYQTLKSQIRLDIVPRSRWFIDLDREDRSRKILELHHAGKLRLIAVTSDRRLRGSQCRHEPGSRIARNRSSYLARCQRRTLVVANAWAAGSWTLFKIIIPAIAISTAATQPSRKAFIFRLSRSEHQAIYTIHP
ncbi:hypothetical protein [Bradyrhizobium sp. RDT46]|uniref:hypothetical protein n=1 Tax=Bradyrhizobium sp. RDT46 TaxID=3341829 RepID=UPI0035C6AD6C